MRIDYHPEDYQFSRTAREALGCDLIPLRENLKFTARRRLGLSAVAVTLVAVILTVALIMVVA